MTSPFGRLVFGSICLLAASIANAEDASRSKEIAERFDKCDVNHDGRLTQAEANGCMPRVYEHFADIDSGNRGYITLQQIQAMAAR